MFKSIKAKLAGLGVVLVTVLLMAVKVLVSRNRKLERENKVKDKEVEVVRQQQNVTNEVINNEQERIAEAVSKRPTSRADGLNSVLNDKG